MSPRRGEVWSADLGLAAKVRPIIILSRDDPDPPRKITVYVPLTTQNRGSKYEVELPRLSFLTRGSAANLQGIASGATEDETLFLRKLGDLPASAMAKVENALLYTVGIQIG
jgi:mRNA interferase MazF